MSCGGLANELTFDNFAIVFAHFLRYLLQKSKSFEVSEKKSHRQFEHFRLLHPQLCLLLRKHTANEIVRFG